MCDSFYSSWSNYAKELSTRSTASPSFFSSSGSYCLSPADEIAFIIFWFAVEAFSWPFIAKFWLLWRFSLVRLSLWLILTFTSLFSASFVSAYLSILSDSWGSFGKRGDTRCYILRLLWLPFLALPLLGSSWSLSLSFITSEALPPKKNLAMRGLQVFVAFLTILAFRRCSSRTILSIYS